jgi:hypothetical protein
MKMTDKEIADNLNEIRLEKALAAELTKTEQIIQRTGLFDPIDNIYGEIGAEYQANPQGGGMGGDAMGGGMGGFGGGLGGMDMGMGDDMGGIDDLGAPGSEGMGDISGAEGSVDMTGAPAADSGAPMENRFNGKPLIVEHKKKQVKKLVNDYMTMINEAAEKEEEPIARVDIVHDNLMINESIQGMLDDLIEKLNDKN